MGSVSTSSLSSPYVALYFFAFVLHDLLVLRLTGFSLRIGMCRFLQKIIDQRFSIIKYFALLLLVFVHIHTTATVFNKCKYKT